MKKVLVFGPDSIHTKKFTDMVKERVDVLLITNELNHSYDVKTKIMKRGISMFWNIRKILKTFMPDYVHIHTINRVTIPVILAAYKKYPIILSAWGSSVLLIPYKSWFHKKFVQYCLKRSTIITVDACIESYTIKKLVGEKITIRNINFGIIKFDVPCDLKNKKDIIYSPRGHASIYNIGKVIESFYEFQKVNPSWQLHIAGHEHPSNTQKYKECIKELGIESKVIFHGYIDQERNANNYAAAKIVVSIPASDGKSHSVMEAINYNCICFVSDIPSNYELVTEGVNGFIVQDRKLIDFSKHKQIDHELMLSVNEKLMPGFTYENSADSFNSLYCQ